MNYLEVNRRRLKQWFQGLCFRLSGADYPFETAHCMKDEFTGENFPENMDKLLAQFDFEDKHFVIYIKK